MFKSKEGTSIQKIIEQDGLYIEQLRDEVIRLNNIINDAMKIFEDNYYKKNTTDINEVIFFGKEDDVSGLMYEKLKEGK